ncbi:uncharacterized protein LOC106053776 isoform X1 [Biomphalaria glabrata]|uniref:Uncharacterized protein LOC106053776 isoform X1 n=1 Tax=Biomphalaria glabrata TaxID=6526 RepID=A0A9W2ZSF9_BIOGL|nr:uncharacterized protein LOC106053776 isoform X1 [Biomphalaria glabrata]
MFVEVTVSVASAFILVIAVFSCLSCLFKKKNYRSADSNNAQHNPAFSVDISDAPGSLERVTIEPLPDILSKVPSATCYRPKVTCKGQQEALLPLNTIQRHFPRDHLTYLNEIGSGWFGQVIESEAAHIVDGSSRTKVVVKILKEDATKMEQKHFMEEVSVFRCLDHVNLLSFLGQCTDILPHLVILEFSPLGTLKTHLVCHRHEAEKLIKKNHLVTFALDVAAGLACLHRHDFIHNDLAARNCLVMSNYTVKIGDYGISDTLFKEEYYNTGRELLPIRWMAPETLVMSNGIWTSNFGDKEGDIWSFGMLLWEILTFGAFPFSELSDEAVLQGVVIDKTLLPSREDLRIQAVEEIWPVMAQCFQSPHQRPHIEVLHQNIEQIVKADTIASITDFDNRWEKLVPYRPELGSRIALAGSFITDDLTPLSDDSYPVSGDLTTGPFENQSEDEYLVDTNIVLKDNFNAVASLPAYSGQAQLSFVDETLFAAKHVAPSPLPAAVHPAQVTSSDYSSDTASNMTMSGDENFVKLDLSPPASELFSVLDESESKIHLLANESNNNIFTQQTEPISEDVTNTSPKYSSGEFTEFESSVEPKFEIKENQNGSKEFTEFVSSFSDNAGVAYQTSDFESSLTDSTAVAYKTSELFSSSNEEKMETENSLSDPSDRKKDSGEFTEFVASTPPLAVDVFTSDLTLPSFTKSADGFLDLTSSGNIEEISLVVPSQNNTNSLIPNFNPDGNGHVTLPSDFSFLEDLVSGSAQKPAFLTSNDLFDFQDMPHEQSNTTGMEIKNDLLGLVEAAMPLSQPAHQIDPAEQNEGYEDPVSEKVGRCDSQTPLAVTNGFTSIDDPDPWGTFDLALGDPVTFQVEASDMSVKCHNDLSERINHDNQSVLSSKKIQDSVTVEPKDCSVSPPAEEDSDTEVSSSSSSGQEYICSGEASKLEPPFQMFGTQSDLDEQTLQHISEIYLSRGVKSPRVFEIPPLETIYENQDMAAVEEEEEHVVDVHSDSSSSEVRLDDQFGGDFEWDDLVNSNSPPHQSFRKLTSMKEQSISDWSLDLEDDQWESPSNVSNGGLADSDLLSFSRNNSVLSKQVTLLPSSWPSLSGLNQTSLYSLMDDYPTDVTSPSEENYEESASSLSSRSASPVTNPSMTPSTAPSLTVKPYHFLYETSEPHHESYPSKQPLVHDDAAVITELPGSGQVEQSDKPVVAEDKSQHSLLLETEHHVIAAQTSSDTSAEHNNQFI